MSDLKIYFRKGCPYTAKLLMLLRENNIKFDEIDLSKNPEYEKEIINRNGHIPTPQVEFRGKIVFDYTNEESLVDDIKGWMKD